MMALDEWRVEAELDDPEHGFPLSERLRAVDLDDEVKDRLGERVIVSRDGSRLYVYTQGPEAAREAERVVRDALAADGLTAEVRRGRWNPVDRVWQDADLPLPEGAADAPEPAAENDEVRYPLFTLIERHEPRFMRDLGL